ncbi:MAG: hypothetical protein ABGW63_05425, partial [Flavobacteriaceae bacterium]
NRGTYSVAMGRNTIASGFHATAFGLSTTSDAWYSTSMGVGTVALSRAETALGSYNTEYDPTWNPRLESHRSTLCHWKWNRQFYCEQN